MENFDTKDAKFTIYQRWEKCPDFIPKWAYNPNTDEIETVEPPFTYIDDNGHMWMVEKAPIDKFELKSS